MSSVGWRSRIGFAPGVLNSVLRNSGALDDYKSRVPFSTANRSMALRRVSTRTRRRTRRGRKRRQIGWGMRFVQPYSIARKLKSVFATAIDPGAGTIGGATIKLNSAFDPFNALSATQQPLGFDQYEALYNRYCVVGWRVLLECVSLDNTNPVMIGFTPSLEGSLLTSFGQYKELPATASRIVTPDMDKVIFGKKGPVKQWLLPKGGKLLTEDLCTAAVTTDPAKLLYGHVWAQAVDGTSDPGIIRIVITLEQIVVFFSPKSPARSTQ